MKLTKAAILGFIAATAFATPALAVERPDPLVTSLAPSAVAALFDSRFTSPGQQFCSGTLVRPTWVLTAAHCVADQPFSTRLSVGFWVEDHRELVRVKSVSYPSWYRSTMFGTADIALLNLARPVPGVKPVPLSITRRDRAEHVFGYGVSHSVDLVTRPLGAPVVVRNRIARELYGMDPRFEIAASVVAKNLSAGPSGEGYIEESLIEGVCNGDSGGPLFGRRTSDGERVVIGVVSYGALSCFSDKPGVYVRTSAYRRWLSQTIESSKEHP